MKKLYTLLFLLCLGYFSFAQNKMFQSSTIQKHHHAPVVQAEALGDTLFLFDGQFFYVTNANDQTDFDFLNEDDDGNTPYNTPDWTSDWNFFYSVDPADFTPGWDIDTGFFMGATSWFSPAGQADNWFTFGPITIPAGGADLSFKNKSNPEWTDGFKVYVSTAGLTPYVNFIPGTTVPVYTKADCNPNPPACTQPAQDTIWSNHTVSLATYAGSRVYIGFFHNTDDGDVCWLDHFLIKETGTVGVAEETQGKDRVFQNSPNPYNTSTVIKYELAQKNKKISLEVFDLTGKKVREINIGEKEAGKHELIFDATELAGGTYFYTLKTDNSSFTRKMVVAK